MIPSKAALARICDKIEQSAYQPATLNIVAELKELLCLEKISAPLIDAKRYAVDVLLEHTAPECKKDCTALNILSAALEAWSESVAWTDSMLKLVSGSNLN